MSRSESRPDDAGNTTNHDAGQETEQGLSDVLRARRVDRSGAWAATPQDPGPCRWGLPDALEADDDLVAVGADLDPATLLEAYASGLFPMPIERRRLGWFSPNPRGIIPLDGLRVTRSLRQSLRKYTVTVDTAFRSVMESCADPSRPLGWINNEFVDAYTRLHRMGWAHSIETRTEDGVLVGGLYGVRINRFFAGESMFSTMRDASKVALVHLVDLMQQSGMELLDVQWCTEHLASLGAVEVPRARYLQLLDHAVGVAT